ncbi:4-(cytidine 5'-diphospho)-2-C-methyl-D-erythritol kinase [Pelotomaculum isophthalicicum JI]|uniref:4-diphosphocytidyl-2-C-methyl-D-erythritol kinase n=1 Tax=Pelotomaculum isophthalicicum JI TaxID=947010 RepID=A0A9X4JUW4_9FIRM|nr:4-(cytidine 5'-diphospho)-2-C-methyl-D-erythritol kinase [Pelotomaculum isophthalicicum]MDF9407061.1 4-(cytidine 5'-diphospho)-2-C-methyl-D-erythritol kinase [Pelotomaculum isophthalicicum JI]
MVIKVYARAKINLTLDVLGKRPDGYHQVETVMQSIELHDCLEFTPLEDGVSLTVAGGEVPSGADNLVYRAALLMRKLAGDKKGISIKLNKNIPVAAGLGGGSADAAATLSALNEIWGIHLPARDLLSLGEKLGSDVPFCLLGGTALAGGRGELLESLPPCPRMGLVLVKPSFGVSTASVYRAYDSCPSGKRPGTVAMIKAIGERDIDCIVQNLANVLEIATISMHPEIAGIKKRLLEAGALGVLMSGSGPTVFGVTADLEAARAVADRYPNCGERVLATETFNPERS